MIFYKKLKKYIQTNKLTLHNKLNYNKKNRFHKIYKFLINKLLAVNLNYKKFQEKGNFNTK